MPCAAQVCARVRPCLHAFFLENFRAPAAWFTARLAYTRGTAVSSMAGYLIGLGDRHSANILLDRRSAQARPCEASCWCISRLGVCFTLLFVARTEPSFSMCYSFLLLNSCSAEPAGCRPDGHDRCGQVCCGHSLLLWCGEK